MYNTNSNKRFVALCSKINYKCDYFITSSPSPTNAWYFPDIQFYILAAVKEGKEPNTNSYAIRRGGEKQRIEDGLDVSCISCTYDCMSMMQFAYYNISQVSALWQ